MDKYVNYEIIEEHIGVLKLNRPEKMNALSSALLQDLKQYLNEIEKDDMIRAVIITGAGEKAFSAGADLKERRQMGEQETIFAVKNIGNVNKKIHELSVPVIAVINGLAFGGGLELALACDMRICANDAKVGLTETSLAIIPGAGGTQRLSRLIGIGQAKKMIYTAQPITAEKAYQLGLVEEVFDKQHVFNEAVHIAQHIINNGPLAIKKAKESINNGIDTDLHTALDIEHAYYQHTIPTEDRLEGLKAFQEKRQPKYYGK